MKFTPLQEKILKLKQGGKTFREIGQILGKSTQYASISIAPSSKERNALIAQAGLKCESCNRIATGLNVHHISYWPPTFKVLCPSCHRSLHWGKNLESFPEGARQILEDLTDREAQTLFLIFSGLDNAQIAESLSLSSKTIEKHRTSLYKKMYANNTGALVKSSIRRGFLSVHPALTDFISTEKGAA